jgi:hypothetical protein
MGCGVGVEHSQRAIPHRVPQMAVRESKYDVTEVFEENEDRQWIIDTESESENGNGSEEGINLGSRV